jgi:hypothetical protein
MAKELSGYELSKDWFDFCFENPEKINPNHSAMYFFIIEHCNRLGWKEKFGLPMEMTKSAIGIKNYRTYTNTFNDLVEWGFILILQRSVNQYSANIIALVKNTKAHTKALSKAIHKHSQKQVHGIVGIDKPITYNLEPINQDEDIFLNDGIWKEQFCMTKRVTMQELEIMQKQFIDDIKLKSEVVDNWKQYFTNSFNKGVNNVVRPTVTPVRKSQFTAAENTWE